VPLHLVVIFQIARLDNLVHLDWLYATGCGVELLLDISKISHFKSRGKLREPAAACSGSLNYASIRL